VNFFFEGFRSTLNQDMEPKGYFFLKNHPAKILQWAPRESLALWIRNAPPDLQKKYFTCRSVPWQIFKILFRGFYSPGSDPPHKIMRYWFYCSTQLAFSFQDEKNARKDMFCTTEEGLAANHDCTILWYKNRCWVSK